MATPPPGPAELAGREAGAGPPLLLLHGLGSDHTIWNGQIPRLAEGLRVLAPDLRGHGRSPTPEGSTFTLDELDADLEAYLGARGIDRTHLVGLSAGGFLALRFALAHPDRVLSLTLIASAAQCDGHTRAVAKHWAEVYRDQGYEAYVLRVLKDVHYPEWLEQHPDLLEEALESMKGRDLRGAVQWGLALRNFDVRAQLGRIRRPTLAVHGMEDRVIDASHARILRQAIPGAELKLFPFVGHLVPLERPEESAAVILQTVARAVPPPANGG